MSVSCTGHVASMNIPSYTTTLSGRPQLHLCTHSSTQSASRHTAPALPISHPISATNVPELAPNIVEDKLSNIGDRLHAHCLEPSQLKTIAPILPAAMSATIYQTVCPQHLQWPRQLKRGPTSLSPCPTLSPSFSRVAPDDQNTC